jgi:hypothetical protein
MAAVESIRRFENASTIPTQSFETARRALFSAASRVLSHHAAALDAKIARMNQYGGKATKEATPREIGRT